MDKIYIRNLTVRCIIGINQDERINEQDVVINITMDSDLEKASLSDDINDTVDYKKIKKQVYELVLSSKYFLIEKMAKEIADVCLSFVGIEKVLVSVDKPGALRFADSVAVEIAREKK